ncbi:MAG: hypothetical protein MRY21_00655 [Simkaniaceae bacterium]|nr:hypothetical protein [Simkaniaceae bacterium]
MQKQQISFYSSIRSLQLGIFVLALLTAGVACFFIFYPIVYEETPWHSSSLSAEIRKQERTFELLPMNEGPLALLDQTPYVPYPNLADEIVLLGRNDRPDAPKDLMKVMLGLKSSKEHREMVIGDRVFLNFSHPDGRRGASFDTFGSPLWISPKILGSDVILESALEVIGEDETKLLEEKRTFTLKSLGEWERASYLEDASSLDFLSELQNVTGFAPDRVLDLYGGDSYKRLKHKPRFQFNSKGQMVFLSRGDTLVWKDCRWQLTNVSKKTRDFPLARVQSVNGSEISFKVWDQSGFHSRELRVPISGGQPLTFRIEDVFARIRQRTMHSVSCKLAGKSTILRKGDWVFHTPSGWKVLKSAQELSQFLDYRLQGELFIFDGLEKVKGSAHMMGHLFDRTRSMCQKVRLPLVEKKGVIAAKQKPKQPDEDFLLFDEDFDEDLDDFEEIY